VEAAVGLSVGAGGSGAAALLVWRLANFYVIFLLGPPAAWLLYLSKPAAMKKAGNAPLVRDERDPL
jgi:uncharacterized membrane protein YbhN (UPF0104 family)